MLISAIQQAASTAKAVIHRNGHARLAGKIWRPVTPRPAASIQSCMDLRRAFNVNWSAWWPSIGTLLGFTVGFRGSLVGYTPMCLAILCSATSFRSWMTYRAEETSLKKYTEFLNPNLGLGFRL